MKRRVLSGLLAGVFAAAVLTGCGDGQSGSSLSAADVTGTWEQKLSDGTQTLTLKSDMTYDKMISLGGGVPTESNYHDTWSISGNTISISYSQYNQVSDYTVTLEGSTMTWDNGDSVQTWQKKA